MVDCPSDDALREFLEVGEASGKFEEHLAQCCECQGRLDALLPAETKSKLLRLGNPRHTSSALAAVMQSLEAEPPPAGFAGHDSRFPFFEPPDRPELLGRLGHYEIRRVLGRGGMGIVFLAHDTRLQRPVAIKALAPLSALSGESRGRFLREAQAAAALNHENIVAIHAIEQVGDMPCLVLQYVPGESLADRLARQGLLPLEDLVDLGRDVARGLAAAHAARLIHRDIKPANILFDDRSGRALIADFGLAKPLDEAGLTRSGLIVGTPEFIAPEQTEDSRVDERSDLFSLGATLYLAATGVSPFRAASSWASLDRVRCHVPAAANTLNPDVPEWLSDLIARLLEKDPQVRLSSAAEVLRRFEAAAPGTVVERNTAETVVGLERPRQGRRSWRLALAAVLIATFGIVGWRLLPRAPQSERAAEPVSLAEGFYLPGRSQPLADLADAIAQAPDGATIEIRGDGPFRCVPLSAGAKRLTIRAATGSHPMLIMDSPGQPSDRPWIETSADLSLAGLDIRWMTSGDAGRTEAELLRRSIVASTGGELHLAHCRIVSGRANCCVGAAGNLRIEACHLVSENGVGAFWRPTSAATCEISDSAVDAWLAITLATSAEIAQPLPAKLRLASNTFRGARGLQFVMELPPRQPLEVHALGNVFAVDTLTVMVPKRRPRRAEATLTKTQALAQLRTCLRSWDGQDNVYRRGLEFVTYAPSPRPTPIPVDVAGLASWTNLWTGAAESSIEGLPRFAEPDADSKLAAPRLERIDDPSGPVPKAGAAADRVGPG